MAGCQYRDPRLLISPGQHATIIEVTPHNTWRVQVDAVAAHCHGVTRAREHETCLWQLVPHQVESIDQQPDVLARLLRRGTADDCRLLAAPVSGPERVPVHPRRYHRSLIAELAK